MRTFGNLSFEAEVEKCHIKCIFPDTYGLFMGYFWSPAFWNCCMFVAAYGNGQPSALLRVIVKAGPGASYQLVLMVRDSRVSRSELSSPSEFESVLATIIREVSCGTATQKTS